MAEIQIALNGGVLPPDYYTLAEQIAGGLGPDVLTLQTAETNGSSDFSAGGEGGQVQDTLTVAVAPPKVRFTASTEVDEYAWKQKQLVIRHSSDDRIIALIEILSPGNKASRHGLRSFVEKATTALHLGYHLLRIDLHAPGPRDPQGIHGAIWDELCDDSYVNPAGKLLTLVAYSRLLSTGRGGAVLADHAV
jgi:hypothetical protein